MMDAPETGKIEKMFDSISPEYDHLNHILSLNVDKLWRKKAVKYLKGCRDILDVACGTGDFSIEIARHCPSVSKITGVDLSEGMLRIMDSKLKDFGLGDRISTMKADCTSLPFDDCSFDAVTIGFGIRNFEHREKALKQDLRVLRPGGKLVILELSVPSIPIVRGLYKAYFTHILPGIGAKVSGDKAAYNYLPASVISFPQKKEWMEIMESCGFVNVRHRALSLGICRMYIGEKKR